jgi:2-iminobutanoate/2-iminopropanoate deaminase
MAGTADTAGQERIGYVNSAAVARLPSFSHAVVAGGFAFCSGVLGTRDDTFELVPGGVGSQTVQALRNLEAILAECGATLADLVKVVVYLTDMTAFLDMDAAYRSVLTTFPARAAVEVRRLALDAAVELDATAVVAKEAT